MKRILTTAAAAALVAGSAHSGGLDRSGQPIGILFSEGNVFQLSFGQVSPSVSGEAVGFALTGESGNMALDYTQLAAGYKRDIGENLSFAVIVDQPYGANVSYANSTGGYFTTPFAEATAESQAITAIARYKLDGGMSVHGGIRQQTISADITQPVLSLGGLYNVTTNDSSAVGFLVGAAYEKPEIALRVAVTLNTPVDHELMVTETCPAPCAGTPVSTTVTTPTSVNIDFQTGIAENTLLFGSIRHAKWTEFSFAPPEYFGAEGEALQDYDNDTTVYSIGVGRRFNEQWSGAVTLGYEAPQGGFAGNLAPTDGTQSIGVGATYTNEGVKITGGVSFVSVGDADIEHPGIPDAVGAEFRGNTAIAAGLRVEIVLN